MALSCGEGGSTGAQIIAQININTDNIATLVPYYAKDTKTDIFGITDQWTNVSSLSVADLPAGEYIVNMSGTFSYDTPNKVLFGRFVLNGGVAEEFERDPISGTGRELYGYAFPYTHAADGAFSITVDVHKEDSTGILDLFFGNAWIDGRTLSL